ncbi:S26 family signal peptidase [Sphingomonas cavernae]|uniref:S26 family signal peptidase n=1 Tax=Sphingomonas cavernae TaxID=2320861 RepID=A0A418WJW4_9SPHN|nr:S26 family signal peptidase [Sphingomonas cavernae]RJF90305.1 S26 family signal peptidase [Sphingomonas cavernae]
MTRRRLHAALIGAIIAGLAHTALFPPRPILLWNASASAPIGLYHVGDRAGLGRGDMVIARVPRNFRVFAARRHYLPANVPLVKRVAAAPGDRVCALGRKVFVNGRWIAERFAKDGAGRPMPWWSGCVTLRQGALFLLMDTPASFDGRYFGPTHARDVVGEARLIWPR